MFDEQLRQIKAFIDKLPGKECKLDHFIVIMLKVMEFPFDKTPYYMIGLKDMFFEIV